MRCPWAKKDVSQLGAGECPNQWLRCEEDQLFISYRHRRWDQDFVEKLFAEIRERARCHAWYDIAIRAGKQWDICVTHAIDVASAVAAVMTPEFCENDPDNVCRKEIMYALALHKRVIPLRVSTDNKAVHLMLCNLSWIDFTSDEEKARRKLIDVIAGRLPLPEIAEWPESKVKLLSFGTEIATHLAEFTGREWLWKKLDEWLKTTNDRLLVITGEPGVGKTAIAAALTDRDDVVGIHFCSSRDKTRDPMCFVASLVEQLRSFLHDSFTTHLEANRPGELRKTPEDAFHDLIEEPLDGMEGPREQKLIVIDGLDVAWLGGGQEIITVLANRAEFLPPWLRIVATTRDEPDVVNRLKKRRCRVWALDEARDQLRDDLRQYIRRRLRRDPLESIVGSNADHVEERLADLAKGSFLYASEVLNALCNKEFTVADLGELTQGIEGYYSASFERNWDFGISGRVKYRGIEKTEYRRKHGALFDMLVAAFDPVPVDWLVRGTGWELKEINDYLNDMSAYIRKSVQRDSGRERRCYELFHRSLRDWLLKEKEAAEYFCDERNGHQMLANALLDCWDTEEYAVDHLLHHLSAAQRWDDLARLIGDWRYLSRRQSSERQYQFEKEFRRLLTRMPAESLVGMLEGLLEGIRASGASDFHEGDGETADVRVELMKRQADWLDTFAYWITSTDVQDREKSRALRQLARRFDSDCAQVAKRLVGAYLDKGAHLDKQEQDWAMRFAELRTWVCQRAENFDACVTACREAERICQDTRMREGYKYLGRCEFVRLRGLALSAMAEKAKKQGKSWMAAVWKKRAQRCYKQLSQLFFRDGGAHMTSGVNWSVFESDCETFPEPASLRRPRGESLFSATVVSNEHDCVSALHVIRYLEAAGGRVVWRHHNNFRKENLTNDRTLFTVLIGGPKSPAMSKTSEMFYRADQKAYLRMYSGLHCEASVLPTSEGNTHCYMLGGISKANTLMAAWEFSTDPDIKRLLPGWKHGDPSPENGSSLSVVI